MVIPLPRPQPLAFGLLALATAALWAGPKAATSRPLSGGTAPSVRAAIPEAVGLWTGRPMPVEQRALEILETDDVSLMEYRQGDQPSVWFAQVAGFGNRAAFHPPELCYVGSHFEVMERGPLTLSIGGQSRQVMRLVIRQEQERFEAWYWFTAGKRVTSNYYQQQAWLLWDAIQGQPMSGTLVRISTSYDDPAATHERLLGFASAFFGLRTRDGS